MDITTLLMGFAIFFIRILDVTFGTMRTISIVQGRTKLAFFLAFVEISLWLIVISTVLQDVLSKPILGVFYALGFAMGNIVGIKVEKKIALGEIAIRIISKNGGKKIAELLHEQGYTATVFDGEGHYGPVKMIYVIAERKKLSAILKIAYDIDSELIYIVDAIRGVNKYVKPVGFEPTGWRAVMKKK